MSTLIDAVKEFTVSQKTKGTNTKNKDFPVQVYFLGRNASYPAQILKGLPKNTVDKIKNKSPIEMWSTPNAQLCFIQSHIVESPQHYGLFAPSPFAMARDLIGACFRQWMSSGSTTVNIEYFGETTDELKGIVVGVEMSNYQFKNLWPKVKASPLKVSFKSSFKNQKEIIHEALCLSEGVNLARFLVDLPPNILTPKSYTHFLRDLFNTKAKTKVNVWDAEKLKKEKMGLHCGVGQGSFDKSFMVHIEYRNGDKNQKPLALVGKGITFDTGGLDIKPSASMRLMKKDMGGSASVAGLAQWVISSQQKLNADFYFAIAENSVSENSMRPGDVLTARNGQTVEIHNTDAEGRLVLADVMTVAVEKKPSLIIDIATLTGSIKQGLGTITPGLFCNDDNLAEVLMRSGQSMGDLSWRMPLIPEERSRLRSDVADLINCTEGYGGAITAALFLESFVERIPWAHFDIYSWVDRPKGVYSAPGGSGQLVQALSYFLTQRISNQTS